jgi:uncharacterized repeat protein (TIGR03803 family)
MSVGFRLGAARNAMGIALAGAVGWTCGAHAATSYSVLYRFPGGMNGIAPAGSLARDSTGALYGTTNAGGNGYGTVFKLTPPTAGKKTWTETVLYRFKGGADDGAAPQGALMIDKTGTLYGTTKSGGNGEGTVFKLTPPAAGKKSWAETVLYKFGANSSHDAAFPEAGVISVKGSLYGTTYYGGLSGAGYGAVYQLTPPAGSRKAWTETVIYAFRGANDGSYPEAEVVADSTGALYGTTVYGGGTNCGGGLASGCGTVFKLVPPAAGKKAWTASILYRFTGKNGDDAYPQAAVAFGAKGVLYGTASGMSAGCVFSLTPPAKGKTAWTETVLHAFTGTDASQPVAPLVIGSGGTLYGTAQNGGAKGHGAVFALRPPASAKKNWTAAILHNFAGSRDGSSPLGGLIQDKSGDLFGTSFGDGSSSRGTVFEVAE